MPYLVTQYRLLSFALLVFTSDLSFFEPTKFEKCDMYRVAGKKLTPLKVILKMIGATNQNLHVIIIVLHNCRNRYSI